eukprot:scaffold23627_cov121-Isochrysis_galbana.AAC.3
MTIPRTPGCARAPSPAARALLRGRSAPRARRKRRSGHRTRTPCRPPARTCCAAPASPRRWRRPSALAASAPAFARDAQRGAPSANARPARPAAALRANARSAAHCWRSRAAAAPAQWHRRLRSSRATPQSSTTLSLSPSRPSPWAQPHSEPPFQVRAPPQHSCCPAPKARILPRPAAPAAQPQPPPLPRLRLPPHPPLQSLPAVPTAPTALRRATSRATVRPLVPILLSARPDKAIVNGHRGRCAAAAARAPCEAQYSGSATRLAAVHHTPLCRHPPAACQRQLARCDAELRGDALHGGTDQFARRQPQRPAATGQQQADAASTGNRCRTARRAFVRDWQPRAGCGQPQRGLSSFGTGDPAPRRD